MEANLAPANPAYHTVTGQTIWSYVYFGSYPQSEVNEADLTDRKSTRLNSSH